MLSKSIKNLRHRIYGIYEKDWIYDLLKIIYFQLIKKPIVCKMFIKDVVHISVYN